MLLNEVYFWTTTIHNWKHLLKPDKYKQIILDSLIFLSERNLIKVYGFVIMPNHVHIMWEMIQKNGKEMPYASFQKYTAHSIYSDLGITHPKVLIHFKVEERERDYRIWKRDPLAVKILSREMAEQKLDYIHFNPLQSHWNLCSDPLEYRFSSISFYESNSSEFTFLTDYRDRV